MPDAKAKVRFSLKSILLTLAAGAFFTAPIGWLGEYYVVSLVISTVMLTLVLLGVWQKATVWSVAFCALPFITIMGLYIAPVAILQGIATAAILLATIPWRHRQLQRGLLCLLAMVGFYAWALVDARDNTQTFDALRASYPITSVAERMPSSPQFEDSEPSLSESVEENLAVFEKWNEDLGWRPSSRRFSLEQLHSKITRQFVAAQGFGVTRMPRSMWVQEDRVEGSPLDPDAYHIAGVEVPSPTNLLPTQNLLLTRFFNPNSFGYVENQNQVSGFQAHGMRIDDAWAWRSKRLVDAEFDWRLTRLELVGILQHEEPVVYVMEGLPSMDRIADAQTRPLDEFEAAALPTLVSEKDLQFELTDAGVRMMGAVRAAKQCLACHATPRGTLLGAFSYELTRAEAKGSSED